jgi:hypothetical protein
VRARPHKARSRTQRRFFDRSIRRALAQDSRWAQAYFVSVTNKPQDSVKLYQHRLRVDQSFLTLLQEVIATVEAIKQQRSTSSDID